MRKRSHEAGDRRLQSPGITSEEMPTTVLYTMSDLDHAVARVRVLKTDAAASMWTLGAAIADIKSKQLWKLRSEAERNIPAWKTWEAFCHHELYMTPKNANSLAEIADRFTEKQVRAFGTTKLGLILQAPPEAREQLEKAIESGATVREIEPQVRKLRDETGHRKSPAGRKRKPASPPASKPKAEAKPEKGKVVVAELEGTHTLKMYKRPDSFDGSIKDDGEVDWSKHARAKKVADHPIALWRMLNDTIAFIEIGTSSGGELICKIQVRREDT